MTRNGFFGSLVGFIVGLFMIKKTVDEQVGSAEERGLLVWDKPRRLQKILDATSKDERLADAVLSSLMIDRAESMGEANPKDFFGTAFVNKSMMYSYRNIGNDKYKYCYVALISKGIL